MPSTDFNWLVAMMMPLAVMKPDTTGCDNRLARKPSRNTPITIRISPDRNANMSAAAMKSALPGRATALAAVRRHQRNHRYRPDRQRAACPEQCISNNRQDRRVETNFGRQSREHGISQTLRDQHDRHDCGGDQIIGQRNAAIATAPFQYRQIARQCHLGYAAPILCGLTIHSCPLSMPCQ